MTNPNDAIGTNAAYGGRTSTNAFNDDLAAYSRGVLSGWNCVPDSGLTVAIGGSAYTRDVAIAQDNAGNKTTINNITAGDEVRVTVAAAPASNSRIDAIVAYVDNPATGNSSEADNPDACGIIPVSGTPSASPVPPTDGAIRTAITADGASGTTAYYVILAYVTVPTGTTDLIAGYIEQGPKATTANIAPNSIDTTNLKDDSVSTNKIVDDAVTYDKIDFSTISLPKIDGTTPQSITVSSSTSVTATMDGYLAGYVRNTTVNTDAQVQIFVNNVACAGYLHIPPTSSYWGQYIGVVPIKKGDTVRFEIINGSFSGGIYENIW